MCKSLGSRRKVKFPRKGIIFIYPGRVGKAAAIRNPSPAPTIYFGAGTYFKFGARFPSFFETDGRLENIWHFWLKKNGEKFKSIAVLSANGVKCEIGDTFGPVEENDLGKSHLWDNLSD